MKEKSQQADRKRETDQGSEDTSMRGFGWGRDAEIHRGLKAVGDGLHRWYWHLIVIDRADSPMTRFDQDEFERV